MTGSLAEMILVLCSLAPCVEQAGTLFIPVPEVPPRTWTELYPLYELPGIRVQFVPLPSGA